MTRLTEAMAAMSKSPPEILRSPLWPQQQCELLYYPGLAAQPFHDPSQFPWIAALEAAYPKIRAELDALVEERTKFMKVGKAHHDAGVDGSWGSFPLYVHGLPVPENHARCPETIKSLDAIPDRIGLAGFMALAPNTHVKPHYGTNNVKLRVHLGLRIPSGAGMRISDQIKTWQEGKSLVLDDSFQHEVWNGSDTSRYILLIDFFHPDLAPEEKEVMRAYEKSLGEGAWRMYAPDAGSPQWEAQR